MKSRAVPAVKEFQEWLDTSEQGDRYVYHRGFLACDREHISSHHRFGAAVARAALKAYEGGLVILVSKLRGVGQRGFDYIAIRRTPTFARPGLEQQAMSQRGQA